jgi:hypothetical protein
MNRLMSQLVDYDKNLTIGEVLELIEQEELTTMKKELDEVERVTNKFQNTYLKSYNSEGIFGKELLVYEIKDFVRTDRTTAWELIYNFNGTKIRFSEHDVFKRPMDLDCVDHFSVKELESLTVITEEEYNSYLETYEDIFTKLSNLISN